MARFEIWAAAAAGAVKLHVSDQGGRLSTRVRLTGVEALQPRRTSPAAAADPARLAIVETIAVAHGGRTGAANGSDAVRRLIRSPRLIRRPRHGRFNSPP